MLRYDEKIGMTVFNTKAETGKLSSRLRSYTQDRKTKTNLSTCSYSEMNTLLRLLDILRWKRTRIVSRP